MNRRAYVLVRVGAVCSLVAVVLGFASSGDASSTKHSAARGSVQLGEIKIGVLYPLTGINASAGQDSLRGVQLATAVLNGRYPKISRLGFGKLTVGRIVLKSSDTQGDPQVGASEVDRLVRNERVAALVGAYQSAVTLTASQRAELLGIPFVNGASSATALTERKFKWFFRTGPSDLTFSKTYFAWLKTIAPRHPVKRTVIFHTNDTYGNDGATVIKRLAARNAVRIIDDISFQPGATDLTSQVQKLRASKPDAVWVLAFTADAVLFTKTMAQLDYTPPAVLAYGAGYADPQFISALGKLANYAITRAAWSQDVGKRKPLAREVAIQFQKNYGLPMTENSARTFTAMMTVGKAIQAARSTDPEKIRRALVAYRTKITIMPWAGVQFNAHGQNFLASGVIQQLIRSQYRVLYPQAVATQKEVWPMPSFNRR